MLALLSQNARAAGGRRFALAVQRTVPAARPPRAPSVRGYARNRQQYEYWEGNGRGSGELWHQRRSVRVAGGLVLLGGGYYVTHLEPVPVSGRRRFMAVSPERELAIGNDTYKQLMVEYKHKLLPQNHPSVQRIRNVGMKLVNAAKLDTIPWEFYVVDEPILNAFVIPGGKVFVFRGMLEVMGNDDGIAAVLGHEIAHQYARHIAEKLSFSVLLSVVEIAMMMVIDIGPSLRRLLFDLFLQLPYSRMCESEADYIGLLLAAAACYDPRAAVTVWERMAQKGEMGGPGMQFLSTHPQTKDRITAIKKWMPEAESKMEHCHSGHLERWWDVTNESVDMWGRTH